MGLSAAAGVLFPLAMWYGVLSMGLAYLFDETRGIPALEFLAVAVLLPGGSAFAVPFATAAAQRGMASLVSPGALGLCLAAPLALAVLWLRARAAEASGAAYLRRRRERAHADADAVLAQNPDDVFALLHKAKFYEEEGRFEEALRAYERAHAVSAKFVTVYALEDHRRRLGALARRRDEEATRRSRWSSRLADARVETVLLGLGLILFFVSWPLGLQLTAYMLFVRWFHAAASP